MINLIYIIHKICIILFAILVNNEDRNYNDIGFITLMKEQQQQLEPLSEKKQPLLASSQSIGEENKMSKRAIKSIERYRKKLLAQVVIIFLICLIVILERVFYQIIVEGEQKTLAAFQLDADLVRQNQQGQLEASGITNSFLQFYGSLSQFPIQFLFLTHVLATIYVSFDALLATKILFVTMIVNYSISLIQMFYAGARPFWSDRSIFASACLQSYNHPSLGLVLMTFVPSYIYYNWKKKTGTNIKQTPLKHIIIGVVLLIITFVIQFFNYYIGTMYIINIVMSLVVSTLLLMISIASNAVIDSAIKKSTILKTDAKKYVFYWLLGICLLGTFVLIVFSGEDLFLDIDWVDSFMYCTKYQNYTEKSYRYDQIIGPWFNFIQTSTLFGWIGAVFGISSLFRNIQNIQWAGGNTKNRILRGLITNILIIPSWFFILLIQDRGNWVHDIGLNDFIVNSLHFFFLYLWIFGYMPVLLLHRLLKITNKDDQQFYVIVDESDVKSGQ